MLDITIFQWYNNGMAKKGNYDMDKIVELLNIGMSKRTIAEHYYDVSHTSLLSWLKNQTKKLKCKWYCE